MSYRQYLTGDILFKLDNEYIILNNIQNVSLEHKYAIFTNGQCGFNYKIEKILDNELIQVIQELRSNRKYCQRSILDFNKCIVFVFKNKTKSRLLNYFKKKI